MTLYRMLLTGLASTLLLLTLLLTFINFAASKRHLIEQQKVELNNTAHSLSFALKPVINQKSRSHVESVINSMFDANFYDSLKISFSDQRPDIEFNWQTQSHFVPNWFMHLFAVPDIRKSVEITSGWQSEAELTIQSSPMFTYIKLWNTTVAFVLIGGLFNLIAIGIFAIYLRKILLPLKTLTAHIKTSSTARTYQPINTTKVSEIVAFVRAYNLMARQNHALIDSLETRTAHLHRTAYVDDLTGLFNRQYLLDNLSGYLNLATHYGNLIVFQIDQLTMLKTERRYYELNEHAKLIADIINNSTSETFTLARLNDTEFALLQKGEDIKSVPEAFELLTYNINQFYLKANNNSAKHNHIAVSINLKEFDSTKALLTELNQRLIVEKKRITDSNKVPSTV
ncbi:LapD/MoxY N-terminal periplasmic domain-containing protein [Vibrio coralliirubri]|uniref:LapD/MoxY N-terminal periplasmic domain-containing protein n=1 Tax=Vibrio coralliirubri TaxID=1516159 RepID=UPI00069BAC4D|nr:LapD/MoxY N-terminal periplasmic domain-containing protein [Vibrio coralliirubri]